MRYNVDVEVDVNDRSGVAGELLRPRALFTNEVVRSRPSPVPAVAGAYAWYFDAVPAGVPVEGCHVADGVPLLYVGISPKAPPTNGASPSRQTLRKRIRHHYRGNASTSTLRLTLGCLLSESLGIELRRMGSGQRLTFGKEGEDRLSAWMAEHAFVTWTATNLAWELEEWLIRTLTLPLNLDHNRHSSFHQALSRLRAEHRARARLLPVLHGAG